MKKSEQVIQEFEKLWESACILQESIGYSYVEAVGETLQNMQLGKKAQQVEGQPSNEIVEQLNKLYGQISLIDYQADDIRKMIQFTFLKAAKEDHIQSNHQMTPDAISLLLAYMLNQLIKDQQSIRVGDLAVGTGNLLSAVINFIQKDGKQVEGVGIDNDEILLHIANQSIALQGLNVKLSLQDSLTDLFTDSFQVMISDLPVGYYPIDENAKRFRTASAEGHSYAHHLLIEQAIEYLEHGGLGMFIVPNSLFETKEGTNLLSYLQKETYIQAMLALSSQLFKSKEAGKSILIVQKKGKKAKQVSQVLLGDIPEFGQSERFMKFIDIFSRWSKEILL